MKPPARAGMHPVGVLWGFRDRKELLESGAEYVVAKPEEVLALCSGIEGPGKRCSRRPLVCGCAALH